MTPRLVHIHFRRYAFVLRFDTTKRKPHARKHLEKYNCTKWSHRFREVRNRTRRSPKNDFNHDFCKLPWWRFDSSAEPLYESYHYRIGTRARNQRPPARPEKYTKKAKKLHVWTKNDFLILQKCDLFSENVPPHEATILRFVHVQLRPCAFVLQFDTTNQMPHAWKQLEQYSWTK